MAPTLVFNTLYRTNIRKKFKKWLNTYLSSETSLPGTSIDGKMVNLLCVECERKFNNSPLLDFSLKQEVTLQTAASGVYGDVYGEQWISYGIWHICPNYILNGGLPTLASPICGAKNFGGGGWYFSAYEIFNTVEFCRNVGREAGGRVFLHELSNTRIESIIALTEFQRLGKGRE